MNIKGTAWISMIHYFNERFGPTGMTKLKNKLRIKDQALLDQQVLPISWIDYAAYMRVLLAADEELGKADFGIVKDVNVYQVQQDISGIYKKLVSLLSPKTVFQTLFKIQRQYFDKGKVEILELSSNRAVVKYSEVPDIPLHHDLDNGFYVTEVLQMAGAKNVRFQIKKCMARGDNYCLVEMVWE